MSATQGEPSFEEALNQLEQAVRRLEEGDLTLEEAIAFYEEGMRLARICSSALESAELQVQKLNLTDDQTQPEAFVPD